MSRLALSLVKDNGRVGLTLSQRGRKAALRIDDAWSVELTLSEAKAFRREMAAIIKRLEALDVRE